MSERTEQQEALFNIGRCITEARSALWNGKSGKAFAEIEAAEEHYERLAELLEDGGGDA